ncbi:MAG: hypothetical protein Q8P01_03680 [bacterium]|nr:hypothetical protein [bacterium]
MAPLDWIEEVRLQDLARREERRAKRNGNGHPSVASQDGAAVSAVPSKTKLRTELYRLAVAEPAERIPGALALRKNLRGRPDLEKFYHAADRLTCEKPPRRLFG